MPRLETPKLDYMPSYIAALREGFMFGSGKPVPQEKITKIENDPQSFLTDILTVKTSPVILPNGKEFERVPGSEFWYVDDLEFIGGINIRHRLNDTLLVTGGHIGYGIRPGLQGQGHATSMLQDALAFCRDKLNLDKILITADDDNMASIKVIEKNGGIMENKCASIFDGNLTRRYWITL